MPLNTNKKAYIVSVRIDADVESEWLQWMSEVHVPDVIRTTHFDSAYTLRDVEADDEQRRGYRFFYVASSEDDLARYLERDADRLRDDHTRHFKGRFVASREILDVVGVSQPTE